MRKVCPATYIDLTKNFIHQKVLSFFLLIGEEMQPLCSKFYMHANNSV